MAVDDAAIVDEALGGEELVVARVAILEGAAERRHVARRRPLAVIRQARGVAEGGAAHADRPGGLGHALGEGGFGAGEVLGDHHGGVVGGAGDQAEHGVADRDGRARLEAELGRALARCEFGDAEPRRHGEPAALQFAEKQIERHHLGERGGPAQRVGLLRIEHLARLGIDDDRRVGGCGRFHRDRGERYSGDQEAGHGASNRAEAMPAERVQTHQHTSDHSASHRTGTSVPAVPNCQFTARPELF